MSQLNEIHILTRRFPKINFTIIIIGLRAWRPGFNSRQVLQYNFLFSSIRALVPTQSLIQWVLEALSPGVKRLGREADHSPPSSAEVKNAWGFTSTPQFSFIACCLVNHRDNFAVPRSSSGLLPLDFVIKVFPLRVKCAAHHDVITLNCGRRKEPG
jgi:hypothetical protein